MEEEKKLEMQEPAGTEAKEKNEEIKSDQETGTVGEKIYRFCCENLK